MKRLILTAKIRLGRSRMETLEAILCNYAFESEDQEVRKVGKTALKIVRKALKA